MEPDKNNRDPQGPGNNHRQTAMVISICLVISLMLFTFFGDLTQRSTSREISYDQFLEMVEKKEVEKVVLEDEKIVITPKEQEGADATYSATLLGDENSLRDVLDTKGEI